MALTVDLPFLPFDFDGVDAALGRAGELAVALDDGHLVLLHQELETLGVLVHDALFALLDGAPVQGDAGGVFEAEGGAVFHVVVDFGVEKQGLSGDAADVQAGSAEVGVFLDEGGLQPKLSGANGRGVSSRPAADDGYVVNGFSHRNAPF